MEEQEANKYYERLLYQNRNEIQTARKYNRMKILHNHMTELKHLHLLKFNIVTVLVIYSLFTESKLTP